MKLWEQPDVEADWSFMHELVVVETIKSVSGAIGLRWPAISADDVEQELYLYLSVRPAELAKYRALDWEGFGHRLYSRGLAQAKGETERKSDEIPLDEYERQAIEGGW